MLSLLNPLLLQRLAELALHQKFRKNQEKQYLQYSFADFKYMDFLRMGDVERHDYV